jgi:hypothetical protein
MIVVTVEMWPGGDRTHKKTLGIAHIINDGTGDALRGDYDVRLYKWTTDTASPMHVWKTGRVRGFARQSRGPWDLLFVALKGIVEGRNR